MLRRLVWATEVVDTAFQANRPVVTMNAEFQVVAGSFYCEHGLLHESEGDQPGNLAALDRDVRLMGFEPLVYGAQKGFLNPDPDLETMQYWAKRNGQDLYKTISFTDGTKIQIESALIANGLNTCIVKSGFLGPSHHSTREGAMELAVHAERDGTAITDYVLNKNGCGEVFIVAKHAEEQQKALTYINLDRVHSILLKSIIILGILKYSSLFIMSFTRKPLHLTMDETHLSALQPSQNETCTPAPY